MATDRARAGDDLPLTFSAFVGRTHEIAEIVSLLASARLFTLTGAGGSGKTRLAVEVATRMRDAFPDGVRWVDLSAINDPLLVPHAVAARCGVVDHGSRTALDSLLSFLRPQHLLLVLDNCEHRLTACAHLIERLLGSCPNLDILATSREALAIPGEVIWLVSPLPVPESDAPSSVDAALSYAAVELFVARATAVLPDFRLSAENIADVVRICRQVEGLPLALELAAARLQTLSLAELSERMDVALHVLTRGSRTAHPRQQTLRATLDWSYDLLSAAERAVFARLAVFAGSFTLGAAEAVCADAGIAESEVLDHLSSLVEKSLVTVQGRQEETRYRLLEPVRQYARDRLAESGAAREAHQRHRDWYAALAAQTAEGLFRQDQGRLSNRLTAEHDNIRAALAWSLASGDAAGAGRIAADIWSFWQLRGYWHEGHRWLEQILSNLREPAPLRAHLLWAAGILARPDPSRAEQHFRESLALWQTLNDRVGTARVLGSLGFMTQAHGDHGKAVMYLEQSLPIVRDSDDTDTLARVLTGLALSLLEVGDTDRATALCLEGLTLYQQVGDARGAAAATANLGLIWQARGDERRAATLWEESLAVRRRIGDISGMAHVLTLLGSLAVSQGAYARAFELYREALALRRQMDDQEGFAAIFEGLAAVGVAQGDLVQAVKLAGAADALRTAFSVPLPSRDRTSHDRVLATLRARLDAGAFGQAWAEGRALSPDQATAVAMSLWVDKDARAIEVTGADHAPPPTAPAYGLTLREVEVLRLLARGLTYAQIAESLVISPRTVDAHVRAIFGKLDVHSRTAATRVALQQLLV